ncbi:MAG: MerR family transcriptional regulator [Bacteroidales bacterium]|nr:MerR family transcriptional regulator [Bacteroidales bacterium]
MSTYSIKDLEKFTGIKAHTLRIWEKRYGVVEPERTPTNIRYYSDSDLKKLLNISILNRHGFKISDIVELTDQEMSEKILLLTQRLYDSDSQIEKLVVSMIDVDENRFDKILTSTIIKLGFEQAVLKVIYPFFERIGMLWQIGSISPAQEHFMSNLIRQKLIVAIDGLATNAASGTDTYLLYLPEGEWHEIGLLFASYLIRKRGHQVVYLGQSVPFENLAEIVAIRHCNRILTQFIAAFEEHELMPYITRLASQFSDCKIFISGNQLLDKEMDLPSNVVHLTHIDQLRDQLPRII